MQKIGIGPIDDAKIRNKIESTALQLQFFHAKMNVRKATQQSLFVFIHHPIGLAISGRLQRHSCHFTA
jgi:hypothetical protein